MNAYLTSLIRTLAAYAVGALLALPAAPAVESSLGVDSTTARTQLTAGAVFVLGAGYYAIVRRLEQRWPALGRFLGMKGAPAYWSTTPLHFVNGPPATSPTRSALELAEQLGAQLVDGEGQHAP